MPKTPLKYKSGSDVQEITTAEHNYLAYLAGLELETASGTYSESVLGSLGKTNQGGTDLSIGTFTNTGRESGDVGDQGTDGSGDLAITTTNTVVYQQDATYSEPSNFRHPLYQHEVSNLIRIQEFNDADQLELGETLAGIIYANDYLGTFQLGSSAPSGDYDIAVANVMTDTRADDTSTVYNLYQRTSMTAPTEIDLMAVARGTSSPFNAKTGTYKGLIVMSDAHRKETAKACLDRYLSTITSSVKPIGSYLIRTSDPTASETGQWTAKGSAIDTRNVVEEENTTTSYTNINSSNHWQTTISNPQDFLTDGISVKVGGVQVASAGPSNTSDTTLTGTSNGKTYTRGNAVSGAPSGSQWYEFTETSTAQTDEIKSGTTNIATYTLYVRTA
jgi:hypothetical protein